ncbi:MAG: glycosyltransferase [Chthoniobacterales bacterium]|nr:glycosyltransferase [Chthoniobacterales bacterium]
MKILNVFNRYLERGGEEEAVEQICDSLAKVVDLTRCDFASADWQGPGAPGMWQQALRMIHNPASAAKLEACEKSRQSDAWLVHNVFPVGSGAVYSEAKKLGIPVIQYLHNFRPFSVNGYLWAGESLALGGLEKNFWREVKHGAWQDSRAKSAWFALVLSLGHKLGWWKNVRAWIAVSEFMRGKFIEAGVPSAEIFTLRHYWRPQPVPPPNVGQHFLYLGRLTEAKGIKMLIGTWELLERQTSTAPRLVIAGDGPLRSFVEAKVERMSAVTYAGELSGAAKAAALAGARALIVPSLWWEGLGLVVYEAYDYARPVLTARSGGLMEIVAEGETGWLHEPGNIEQLAAQVRQLEENPALGRERGAAGRRWLLQNADEKEWQQGFLKIAGYAMVPKASEQNS